MDDSAVAAQDSLDARLDASRVRLVETDDLHAEVDAMVRALAPAPRTQTSRTRRRRVLTGMALGAVLIGGGSAAAAASGVWSPWAEDPDLAYEFALPSGGTCEVRYGLFSTDPKSSPIDSSNLDPGLADWLTATDVVELADVDAALAAFESGEVQLHVPSSDDDGDLMYAAAVEYAVGEVINAEVAERGLPGLAYGTETMCNG